MFRPGSSTRTLSPPNGSVVTALLMIRISPTSGCAAKHADQSWKLRSPLQGWDDPRTSSRTPAFINQSPIPFEGRQRAEGRQSAMLGVHHVELRCVVADAVVLPAAVNLERPWNGRELPLGGHGLHLRVGRMPPQVGQVFRKHQGDPSICGERPKDRVLNREVITVDGQTLALSPPSPPQVGPVLEILEPLDKRSTGNSKRRPRR